MDTNNLPELSSCSKINGVTYSLKDFYVILKNSAAVYC